MRSNNLSVIALLPLVAACSPGTATVTNPAGKVGTSPAAATAGLPSVGPGHGAAGAAALGGGAPSATPTTPNASTGANSLPPIKIPPPAMMPASMAAPSDKPADAPAMAPTASVPMMPPGTVGDPEIPMISGDCPNFTSGTITFMGLGGIQVAAAPMPAQATAPMVFYWHGTGSFSGEYAGMAAAVASGVQQEGGVLISFQDSTGGDALSGTSVFGMGDFKLTDQLLACAVKNHNIDPHRVFTTGCSAGGLFATAMAAIRSSYIAAAAPNSGGMAIPSGFQNKHTPALMTIHGAPGSDVVIIDFSNSSATADMIFKQAGGFVINCNHGGGHCGGGGLAPDIWTFFEAHPFGIMPEPWVGGLPSGFNPVCKIM